MSCRLARFVLLVYPRAFREQFGHQLLQAMRDSRRLDPETSRAAEASRLLDLLAVGLLERCRAVLQRIRPVDRTRRRIHTPKREFPMSTLIHDVRFALRSMLKQPAFTLIVIVTIGLGVGANTAMFSIVSGVLLRGLPVEDPDELVRVYQSDRMNGTTREGVSGPDYFDYVERQTVFERLGAFTGLSPTITDATSAPERLSVLVANHTLLPTLGREPVLGRGFAPDEELPQGRRVGLLSHGLWTRRFGSDSSVVGRPVTLDGVDYEIVGVLPQDLGLFTTVDLWVNLQWGPTTHPRGNHSFGVIARRGDAVTLTAAQQDMTRIMEQLEEEYASENIGRGAVVVPLEDTITGAVRPALWLLMGAVGLVLIIACANVANLLFSRGTTRQREVAVRAAIGAGRARLMGQLITESLVLAAFGGVVGVLVALGAVRLLLMLAPTNLPRLNEIALSPSVLGFAFLVTALTGVVFGTLPALQVSRADLNHVLSESGRTATSAVAGRVRSSLAILQVALAFVLVVGAGLLIQSMWNLTRVDPGFQHEQLVRLSVTLPQSRYPTPFAEWPHAPAAQRFFAEALDRAGRMPQVTSAALAANHPLNPGWTTRVVIEGGPTTVAEGVEEERMRAISHGYFATIGTPLLQGRDFTAFDGPDAPQVAIINQAFARKYFPDVNPVGKRIQWWGRMRDVVGVVADVRFMGLNAPVRPAMYGPMNQQPFTGFDLLLRVTTAPQSVIAVMKDQIVEMDGELAVFNSSTFEQILSRTLAPQRFNMMLLGVFAGLALVLASVGIYGVIAYGVSRRIHEFGVRMSLGSDSGALTRLVLLQGVRLTAVGVLVGLAGALAGSRLIAGLLFNVAPADPITIGAVAVFLSAVAVVASFVPARRASRVDPVIALRQE